jgi:hypothetical protein
MKSGGGDSQMRMKTQTQHADLTSLLSFFISSRKIIICQFKCHYLQRD